MTGSFGATPAERGFRFRVWAPAAQSVQLHVFMDEAGQICVLDLSRAVFSVRDPTASSVGDPARVSPAEGVWETVVSGARHGDRYAFSLDGRDPLPDPASRFQPDGVHAWSAIVDPRVFAWTDSAWHGLDPRRAVIYELHVGTFTPNGTFRSAIEKLPFLRALGVTAIELMPLADFAGRRNWGYDGVALFAPARAYGSPEDLRALVDAAHREGLAVLVDVVYNHLGPEGAYLPTFSPAFFADAPTPWGAAVNLDGPGAAIVRMMLIENARHWVEEYHADGLRLDATHTLIDRGTPPFVAELTASVHEASGGLALVYAEDARNLAAIVDDPSANGWGLDGVWADDFHHVVRRMLAGDSYSYYADFEGTATELAAIIRTGWFYTGQRTKRRNEPRGTDPSRIPLRKSVVCIQNHDQIGNRAVGDRLHHTIEAARWRAAVTLLLTTPMTPLLFMGQEWAASTPFTFFTDFEARLGDAVVEGRKKEFAAFPEFSDALASERIPNPQADTTFEASRLRWNERQDRPFSSVLALTERLLSMRAARASLQASDLPTCDAEAIDDDTVTFVRPAVDGALAHLVVVRLRGQGTVQVRALAAGDWTLDLDTENDAYVADGDAAQPPRVDLAGGRIAFQRPGALVFRERGA